MDGERLRSCVGGKIIVSIMQLEHLNSGVKLRFILPKSEQREMYISDESIFPQNRIWVLNYKYSLGKDKIVRRVTEQFGFN